MANLANGKVCLALGKRNTGKSYLIRDILFYKQDVSSAVAISATEQANGFYSTMMPPLFIYEEFDIQIIDNVLKRQRLLLNEKQKNNVVDTRCVVVLDDVMHDPRYFKEKQIRNIFMNGRHWSITLIVASQYAMAIPPNLRANIDYIFILRENILSNKKRLYEHYAGMFPSFDFFNEVLQQITEDYHCLVIDNTARSNALTDQIFWYKAGCHPDFKIGDQSLWTENDKYFKRQQCYENAPRKNKKKGSYFIMQ